MASIQGFDHCPTSATCRSSHSSSSDTPLGSFALKSASGSARCGGESAVAEAASRRGTTTFAGVSIGRESRTSRTTGTNAGNAPRACAESRYSRIHLRN